MKQILLVFGTRPEAIKMAPLVKALRAQPEWFDVKVCVTGQHRQMLDQVLGIFGITPDFDLNIMKPSQDLFDVTTAVLLGMRGVFQQYHPDIVLVHGDTTTSTAVALAAFYCHIAVGHVEAGLRTFNIYSPWPEEINRQLTGRLATLHFSPTARSKANLLAENVLAEHVFVTGNTVTDALLHIIEHIRTDAKLQDRLSNELCALGYDPGGLASYERRLILITGHRRENFGEGFLHICEAIRDLALRYPAVDFVYPMHLNPNVRQAIDEIFPERSKGNLFFIEPLDYLHFVYLMDKSYLILTDSGGVQEEAPTLGKPVLVMRDTTERPEAVEAGTVKLVGTDYGKIVFETSTLLDDHDAYQRMSMAINPYGDGKACMRISGILRNAEL